MADDCVSTIELSIEAVGLRDMDILSKSDPFAILYTRLADAVPGSAVTRNATPHGTDSRYNQITLDQGWLEYGRTETIQDNLNPKFAKSFVLPYYFERNQYLRVELYDRDSKSDERLAKHDYLGGADVRLADVIASRGQLAVADLEDDRRRKKGQVTLFAEEVLGVKRAISLDLKVALKKRLLALLPPLKKGTFFTISRAREGGTWALVYKSNTAGHRKLLGSAANNETELKPFKISSQKLNNGDPGRPLRFDVYVYAPSGSHKHIGQVTTCEIDLIDKVSVNKDSIRPLLINNSKNKPTAELQVVRAVSKSIPTFLDYIFGGCEVNLLVAIDFTSSNGDPRCVGTLHYNDINAPNEYEAALRSVCSVLAPYDSDQLIPAYGYGARLPPDDVVSHCFALTGKPNEPNCQGVEGLIETYRTALQHVSLSGPTVFSQIISLASGQADTNVTQDSQRYTILLIITDGIISDLDATKRQIVRASELPLSIVIVGVGSDQFKEMEMLDADDVPLVADGETMKRDIVQFVPFRKFRAAPEQLAEEVLKEIPDQMLSFMECNNIKPNPPRQASPQSLVCEGSPQGSPVPPEMHPDPTAAGVGLVHEGTSFGFNTTFPEGAVHEGTPFGFNPTFPVEAVPTPPSSVLYPLMPLQPLEESGYSPHSVERR